MFIYLIFLTTAIFFNSFAIIAEELLSENDTEYFDTDAIKLSGFATFGLTYHNNDTIGTVTSFAQKKPANDGISTNLDSVLGLQLDWQLLQNTSATIQGLARKGDSMQPELRMGYLRQQFWNDVSIRFGRIRSPFFFDSDVAEIGYASMTVRPSMTLYNFPNSFRSIDGADLQWQSLLLDTPFSLQYYYGNSEYKHRFYDIQPNEVEVGTARLNEVNGLVLNMMLPNITFRVAHSRANFTMNSGRINKFKSDFAILHNALLDLSTNPSLPESIRIMLADKAAKTEFLKKPYDAPTSYTSIGFDANVNTWRFMGEGITFTPKQGMVPKHIGFNLTIGHTLGEFQPYVAYSRLYRTGKNFDTNVLAPTGVNANIDAGLSLVRKIIDDFRNDFSSYSITAGVRWDFRENIALKVQYDYMKTSGADIVGSFVVYEKPFNNEMHLFTLVVDIIF